jgi:hypothetical protein
MLQQPQRSQCDPPIWLLLFPVLNPRLAVVVLFERPTAWYILFAQCQIDGRIKDWNTGQAARDKRFKILQHI